MAVNYCLALFSIYRSKGAREQKVKNKIPSKLDAPDSEKYVYPCTTGYNLEFVNSLNDQWGVVNWTSFPSEGFLIHSVSFHSDGFRPWQLEGTFYLIQV